MADSSEAFHDQVSLDSIQIAVSYCVWSYRQEGNESFLKICIANVRSENKQQWERIQ
jgi:hypothetical protein